MSIAEVKRTAEHKMQRSLETLRVDLAKVRTGRAHIGLLDHVQVEYYGSHVPINTVAVACANQHGRQRDCARRPYAWCPGLGKRDGGKGRESHS